MFRSVLRRALAPAGLEVVARERRLAECEQLDRLRAAVDHERRKVARLKAQLEESGAEADRLRARVQKVEGAAQELRKDYRLLLDQLRWHWSAYPGSAERWEARSGDTDPFALRARAMKARLVELLARPEFESGDQRVTAVVTSCDRHDLLVRILDSFFATNTCPIEKLIVVEDGERALGEDLRARFEGRPIEWMTTGGRVGQIRAIDAAYARVSTPYIFHFEDDFEFVAPGYVESSMRILESEPLCLQVWLRGFRGKAGHPLEEAMHLSQGVAWRRVAHNVRGVWHGFSFNPGLRRLRDYRVIGSAYAAVAEAARGRGSTAEMQLSELYGSVGYFAAALWRKDGEPFTRHRGQGRHVD